MTNTPPLSPRYLPPRTSASPITPNQPIIPHQAGTTDNNTPTLFQCKYNGCGKSFKREYDKNRHLSAVHLKERTHKCTVCFDTYFSDRGALNRHGRLVHDKQRTYKCNLCNLSFGQSQTLKTHQNSARCAQKGKLNALEKLASTDNSRATNEPQASSSAAPLQVPAQTNVRRPPSEISAERAHKKPRKSQQPPPQAQIHSRQPKMDISYLLNNTDSKGAGSSDLRRQPSQHRSSGKGDSNANSKHNSR